MNWSDYLEKHPETLLSNKMTRALLSDILRNDQLKVNLMMNAYGTGIVESMRNCVSYDSVIISQWETRLVSQFGITDDNARWVIKAWGSLLNKRNGESIEELAKQLDKLSIKEKAHEAEAKISPYKPTKNDREETEDFNGLNNKDDYDDYYLNPKINEAKDYIYIPCGFGKGDYGFKVYGIQRTRSCNHSDANVYALIYNYITRNSTITKDDIPNQLKNVNAVTDPDYRTIYRLSILLLLLIRHNCTVSGRLVIDYDEDLESLNYAVSIINNYIGLFSRIIGVSPKHLTVDNGQNGINISLKQKTGVFVRDNDSVTSNAREIWYGKRINYHIDNNNLGDLEYILSEISEFKRFKPGQYEALCSMLSAKGHSVCIMPTGSGKSLIFYLASLLQPLPVFVVAPTDILIRDQIRNLNRFHHMDNVAHLQLTDDNDFADWQICNSINYLTPMTFQSRNLLERFIQLNKGTRVVGKSRENISQGSLVSYIVLDEIHCLSNWGHDFRPEYLMLSRYLNKYCDQMYFLGFTATANYTVVEDVRKQLDIPQDNFFSPLTFEKYNVNYDFRSLKNEVEMLTEIKAITAPIINRGERTIVFTKNDEISRKVADAIGWEADIYSADNPDVYYHFAAGESNILVASDDLGIGVNLPGIQNVIHFGLPLSKNEYVQEIGRAGRADEVVTSYVLYLNATPDNVPEELLKRNTAISSLPVLLKGLQNDYAQVYRKLSNGAVSEEELYNRLIDIYRGFLMRDRALYVEPYPLVSIERIKQYLYMLYLSGFIHDWYSYSKSKDTDGIDVFIDICATGPFSYKDNPNKMLVRMKERLRSYFVFMGNNRKCIAMIDRSTSAEDVISVFVNWYYENYLYHHIEQFLDLFEFIETNKAGDKLKITKDIKDYFILPFTQIKSDDALYNDMTYEEIIGRCRIGIDKGTLVNLERINSNAYSCKIDFALFCGSLSLNSYFDEGRLQRIISRIPQIEKENIATALSLLYHSCNIQTKIDILKFVKQESGLATNGFTEFFEKTYANNKKDIVYYGVIAESANGKFEIMRRADNV